MAKFMWVNLNCRCVWTISCLIACGVVHSLVNVRFTNCMNLQFAPAHKVVINDDNWCQNLFTLLVCIFLT